MFEEGELTDNQSVIITTYLTPLGYVIVLQAVDGTLIGVEVTIEMDGVEIIE